MCQIIWAFFSYNLSSSTTEFGNFYAVQALMGWIPEVIPVQWVWCFCQFSCILVVIPLSQSTCNVT